MFSEAEKNNLVTGYKQTSKALCENRVAKVLIANDCESSLFEKINSLAKKSDAQILYVESMQKLGQMCNIDLGASCAAILK